MAANPKTLGLSLSNRLKIPYEPMSNLLPNPQFGLENHPTVTARDNAAYQSNP